ncbi:MAG: hypothetical protein IJE10_01015 [Clostridia bacterium]|nr:hypothetical protein [Clostridia bacterium]
MKRFGIIILSVFMMLILVGVWIICDNWNTITALVDSVRYTSEELEVQMEETKEELQNFLDENEAIVVRDLNEEEQNALNEGKISGDQAILILTGQSTLEEEIRKAEAGEVPPPVQQTNEDTGNSEENGKNDNPGGADNKPVPDKPGNVTVGKENPGNISTGKNNAPTTSGNKNTTSNNSTPSGNNNNTASGTTSGTASSQGGTTGTTSAPEPSGNNNASADQKISEYIAQLYVYKNEFLNRLAGLENTISNEFYSQPQSEWNRPNKERIVSKYMGQVGQWEKECDSKVYGVLDQIETTLTEAGRDTSVVTKIEENYLNEKRLKKAFYMERYTK